MHDKKKDFRILSDVGCEDCGRKLKQNLIDKNPDANKCYNCHKGKNKLSSAQPGAELTHQPAGCVPSQPAGAYKVVPELKS